MHANYFSIDGSALMAQIRQLQRAQPEFRHRKLCPKKFIEYQMATLTELHVGSYKRATFYFAKGDEANINEYLVVPDYGTPGAIRDIHFKYCGHKLKKSAEFDKFVEESVPPKFQSRFSKSEKGVDIEICCDALRLVSKSQVDRIFLLTNDGDFIPFLRAIKEFGVNISVIHLSTSSPPNAELLCEADSYDVVSDHKLNDIFTSAPVDAELPFAPNDEHSQEPEQADALPHSEKPDTAPSDLASIFDGMEENE